jgi:hypothetical protein
MGNYLFASSGNRLSNYSTESVFRALKDPAIQEFLRNAESTRPNGGPRDDQLFIFGCKAIDTYPLQYAAMMGDVARIRHLIRDQGVDPNNKCSAWYDAQAIGWAASYGQLHALIALLQVFSTYVVR